MHSIRLLIMLVVMGFTALPLAAQEGDGAADAPQAEAATAEETSEEGGDGPAEGPAFPAGLDAPGIPLDELELRLIPLTVAELEALAEAWQGIVRRQAQAVADLQVDVLESEGEVPAELQSRLREMTDQRREAFARFAQVVSSYANKGGDQAVIDSYRAYRTAILVEEQQTADWRTLLDRAMTWSLDPDGGLALAVQVAVVIAAFLALILVGRIVRRIARRGLARVPNLSKLLQAFLATVAYWLTLAIGLMVVLSALGVDITPLFALLGGASFIAAFAFQDTLGNLAAGLMIMINRPFDEGDYVTVAGTGGTVQSVSIVSTTVTTPDNQVIVIPNGKVWGDVIQNVTASDTRRVDLVFGIGYDDSIEEAQKILEETVNAHRLVLSDPAPVIRVNALGASSVDFICWPWARAEDYFTVKWDLTRQVKEAFDRAGITIPYPQTDMHLHVRRDSAPLSVTGTSSGMGRPDGAPDFASGDAGAAEEGGTAERAES